MQKGFIPILIVIGVVVVLAVLGAGYLLGRSASKPVQTPLPVIQSQPTLIPKSTPQPTITPKPSPAPDETAGWKILTVNECGFSLKYPNNWAAETGPRKKPPGVVEMSVLNPNTSTESEIPCAWVYVPLPGIDYTDLRRNRDDDFYIYINRALKGSLKENIVLHSLDDYIRTYSRTVPATNIQERSFNNLRGKYYETNWENPPLSSYIFFIFERGNYIYQVLWPKQTNENYKKEVELIINSINF